MTNTTLNSNVSSFKRADVSTSIKSGATVTPYLSPREIKEGKTAPKLTPQMAAPAASIAPAAEAKAKGSAKKLSFKPMSFKELPSFINAVKEVEGAAYWRPVVNAENVLACRQSKVAQEVHAAVIYNANYGVRKHSTANAIAWVLRKHIRGLSRDAINALSLRAVKRGDRTLPKASIERLADCMESEMAKYEALTVVLHQLGAEAIVAFELPSPDGEVGDNPFASPGVDEMSLEDMTNAFLAENGEQELAEAFDEQDEDDGDDDGISARDREIASAMRAPTGSVSHSVGNVMRDSTTVDKVVWLPVDRAEWVESVANPTRDQLELAANFAASAEIREVYNRGILSPSIRDAFYVSEGGRIPAKPSAGLLKLRTKRINLDAKIVRLNERVETLITEQHRYENDSSLAVVAAIQGAKIDDEQAELEMTLRETVKQRDAVAELLEQMEEIVPYLTWEFPFEIAYTTSFILDPLAVLGHEVRARAYSMGQSMPEGVARARVLESLGSPDIKPQEITDSTGRPLTLYSVSYTEMHLLKMAAAFPKGVKDGFITESGRDAVEAFIAKAMGRARYRVTTASEAEEAMRIITRISEPFAMRNKKVVPVSSVALSAEILGDLA